MWCVIAFWACAATAQTDQQFLDDFLATQRTQFAFPSAVISFRQAEGSPALTSVTGTGVGPTTLFRLASVTKCFIGVALMKLVDDGLLTLQDEAAQHMPPELAAVGWPPEIKVLDLMVHMAGLDDVVEGSFVSDWTQAMPLVQYLVRYNPPLSRPVRSVPAYSNYGVCVSWCLFSPHLLSLY